VTAPVIARRRYAAALEGAVVVAHRRRRLGLPLIPDRALGRLAALALAATDARDRRGA